MPFYTTDGTVAQIIGGAANTEAHQMALQTSANQGARICQCLLHPENQATVGGFRFRFCQFATPTNSGPGAFTPGSAYDPNAPAGLLGLEAGNPIPNPGSGVRTTFFSLGVDQRGPSAIWAARNRDQAIYLAPNGVLAQTSAGGASGNAEALTIATTAAVVWSAYIAWEEQ